MKIPDRFGFYEFFAGGGMARLGLGKNWNCLMANDLSQKKCRAYQINFGGSPELINKDVAQLTAFDLPEERPMLAWASFPCQDLSLAGNREGLNAKRSGTFWPFWNLIKTLDEGGRPVPLIVLENVAGAITSHAGKDFRA
ncbi:MAG: DNA cytosine methyltransferase, partial [Nitrospinaceae bacterium]